MNAFQIKSYLFPDNVQVSCVNIPQAAEIRRFTIGNKAGIYQEMVEKIRAAYNGLIEANEEIRTYWQDEENELVGFSSDSEMQFAIDIQAALKASKSYEGSSPLSIFKVYVSKMMPKIKNEPKMGQTKFATLHPGIVCDGCDSSIYGLRFKCAVCPDYDLCNSCEDKGMHQEHKKIKIDKPHGFKMRCPYFGRRNCHKSTNQQQQSNDQDQPRTSQAGTSNPFAETFNNFIPLLSASLPMSGSSDQIKSFGENLKKFLDPFGIDVDYFVENNSTNKEEVKKEENEENKNDSKLSPDVNDLLTPEKMDESKPSSPINPSTDHILEPTNATAMPNAPAIPSAPSQEELNSIKSNASPYESAANALKNMIEKNEGSSKKLENDAEENDFNLIDIEKEIKIIKTIESLREIGYSDDGGWLTRLVTAKNGDINAVLDTISPNSSKN